MGPTTGAKELFLRAAELPTAERERFLAEACGGDADLETRVRRLLDAHDRAQDVLGSHAWPPSTSEASVPFDDGLHPGARIGPYRLVEEIGEGGFGTVWRAEQEAPLRRDVALKILKAGLDTREVVARFEAERQALALMEHPGIARVFGGGATERGRPYFAMELVHGAPITAFANGRGMGLKERLELFQSACRAVQHAHQKGVIHRDLKPSNVLVTVVDGRPVPKVIDFGIAKATDRRLTEKTFATRDGQMVGTPAYMSPEQVDESLDVDTRSDVYALGVLLYELLSGSTPFHASTVRDAGYSEVQRVIREVEPPRPSTHLVERLRKEAGKDVSVAPRDLRGDLDWIVMRCLEKDRERRYESVAVLANEIQRHLAGEPVLAGPPTAGYRISKFVRRHRAGLAVAGTIALLLIGGIVVTSGQARRARAAELAAEADAERARTELARASETAGFLEHLLLSIDPAIAQGQDVTLLRQVLERAADQVDAETPELPEVEASLRRIIGGAYVTLALYDEAEEQLTRALALRREARGDEHTDTLQSMEELGYLYLHMSRHQEAAALFEPCYETRRRLLGETDTETLAVLGNLAIVRHRQGRLEEAAELLTTLETARRETLGERHELTVLTMNNLAGVLEDMGRLGEALERFERAMEIQLETRGESHPHTLAAIGNLGSMYWTLGRHDEAEPLLLRALDIKRRILPEGHPSLLVTLANLGNLYASTGRRTEAERILDEGLDTSRAVLGDRHETTIGMLFTHGRLLIALGLPEEAEEELSEAAYLAMEVLGEHHRLTLSSESALAEALLELGRPAEAEPLARRAADNTDRTFPIGNPAHGVFHARLGLILSGLGKDDEAVEVLTRAHPHLGGDSEDDWRQRVERKLRTLHEQAGRFEEAERWTLPGR